MNQELTQLLFAIGAGTLIGGFIVIPMLIARWRNGEKLIPKKGPTPRWAFDLGIILFGLLAIGSYSTDRPLFGTFFMLTTILYVIGLMRRIAREAAEKPE